MTPFAGLQSGEYQGLHDYMNPEARALGDRPLSVAIIDPNLASRRAVEQALKNSNLGTVRSFVAYPELPEHSYSIAKRGFDVIFIGLDHHPQSAFSAVEAICTNAADIAVIAYSATPSRAFLARAMEVGVREFLRYPFRDRAAEQAFQRAAERIQAYEQTRKKQGIEYVFCGAKGGSGVTTIASNFAVSLKIQSRQTTVLIDLDLPLGDTALHLGLASRYSSLDALNHAALLDEAFLSGLLVKHASGLFVLPAPGIHTALQSASRAVGKVLAVARRSFEHVVIDAGCHWAWSLPELYEGATRIYLVTQVGVPELRNCHRVINSCLTEYEDRLEIILNRYRRGMFGLDDADVEKALTKPASWRVPSDYVAVRRMQNEATPLAFGRTAVARVIREMARTALVSPAEAVST